jgi:hypothetical protein
MFSARPGKCCGMAVVPPSGLSRAPRHEESAGRQTRGALLRKSPPGRRLLRTKAVRAASLDHRTAPAGGGQAQGALPERPRPSGPHASPSPTPPSGTTGVRAAPARPELPMARLVTRPSPQQTTCYGCR